MEQVTNDTMAPKRLKNGGKKPLMILGIVVAALAVAATGDRAVNRAVGEEARGLGIPVSVADRHEECTFYFPAVCLAGGLSAGVVSQGEDHHKTARAARAIREVLEELP